MRPLFLTVFRKEMRDHFRDRRSLTSALVFPIFGPAMFFVIFSVVTGQLRKDKPLVVHVAGAQAAPNLIGFLERQGAQVKPAPADYEAKIREGELDFVLSIPPEYGTDFSAGRPAAVQLVHDSSHNSSGPGVSRTRALVERYQSELGALRLLARGVNPSLAGPVALGETDLATPQKTAASVLNMVPMFLLMAVFLGGMYLAIDAMAGERERGSLEPLLVNPVSRGAVAGGKWMAGLVATGLAMSVTLAAFLVALARLPLQEIGIQSQLGPYEVTGFLLVLLPLACFATALQMLVALFARSFKEATTYLSLMNMLPMIPSMYLMLSQARTAPWMSVVPVLGQSILMTQILRGEGVSSGALCGAAAGAALGAAICLASVVHLLGQERIVFGRSAN